MTSSAAGNDNAVSDVTSKNKLSAGSIVGIIIAIIALLVIVAIIVIAIIILKRKKDRKTQKEQSETHLELNTQYSSIVQPTNASSSSNPKSVSESHSNTSSTNPVPSDYVNMDPAPNSKLISQSAIFNSGSSQSVLRAEMSYDIAYEEIVFNQKIGRGIIWTSLQVKTPF